jgi:thioredoxin reductase (NADPH)
MVDPSPPRPAPTTTVVTDPLLAPRLSEAQIEMLRPHGVVRSTMAGQVLFREGDRGYDFIVILSGSVTVVDHLAGVRRELAIGGPGEFVAELNLFTGERLFTGAVVSEPGAVLVVPLAELRQIIDQDQPLGDLIVQTAFRRRHWLTAVQAGMLMVGSRRSPLSQQLLEFAKRNRLAHVWLDLDRDPEAGSLLDRLGIPRDGAPVVVMRGAEVLRQPSTRDLARAAGFGSRPEAGQSYDLVVVGAGPAGLAASVYGTSEGLATALVDGAGIGGQIGTTSRIDNYLGFPVGVSGDEFAERALVQVRRFGAALLVPSLAVALAPRDGRYVVQLDAGEELVTGSVILAMGVSYRRLDVAGLERFEGTGIFYTPLAALDEVDPGDAVVIVGGGNSAGQAATALAEAGHHVTIVVRSEDLTSSMSQYLIDRITPNLDIDVVGHSAVQTVGGTGRLEHVEVEDLTTGDRRTLSAGALFVLIGAEPHTQWLAGSVVLDDHGFVMTGPDLDAAVRRDAPWNGLHRDPYLLETNLPGVFAAGDVRSDSVKRVASAVGEGSIAVRFVSEFLGRRAGFAAPARSAG